MIIAMNLSPPPPVATFLDILHDPRTLSCLGSQWQCLWEHHIYGGGIFRLVNLITKWT